MKKTIITGIIAVAATTSMVDAQIVFDTPAEGTHNALFIFSNLTGQNGLNLKLDPTPTSFSGAGAVGGAGWQSANALAWDESTDRIFAHFGTNTNLTGYKVLRNGAGDVTGFANTGDFGAGWGNVNALGWKEGTNMLVAHFGVEDAIRRYDFDGTNFATNAAGDITSGGWGLTMALGWGENNRLVAQFDQHPGFIHTYDYNGTDGLFTGTGTIAGGFGPTVALAVGLNPVPEPSSTALLGLGALGLLIRRKR